MLEAPAVMFKVFNSLSVIGVRGIIDIDNREKEHRKVIIDTCLGK
jgi:hypothetical protein